MSERSFSTFPQVTEDDLDDIQWAWRVSGAGPRRERLYSLLTRLRSEPLQSTWTEITDDRSSRPDDLMVWATDGENVEMAYRDVIPGESADWRDEDGSCLSFTPTHWTSIFKPDPPKGTP